MSSPNEQVQGIAEELTPNDRSNAEVAEGTRPRSDTVDTVPLVDDEQTGEARRKKRSRSTRHRRKHTKTSRKHTKKSHSKRKKKTRGRRRSRK